MPEKLTSKAKTEIIVKSIATLDDVDLANLLNAIQNEQWERSKKSKDKDGNFSSTETI